MDDASQLMERVRARDPQAFEAIYDRFSRLVYGVALRVVGDHAAAQDVTQAVFLTLWNAPRSYREGNLTAWLVRVARNRALDTVRSRAAHPQVELSETMPEADGLEDTVLARLDSDAVRRALNRLSETERSLIELGFFDGLTHQELARRTGAPLGTVKTRIRSALRKLRASLEGTTA
ncbi:MAG TPA: sigma-70 family RNA polymerase sigma factor [Verrucomicrobiae bacterium]|nr:sigma-70 family RNA polymerase sigma factor [Verrucomicrobiae bacterium]